MQRLDDQPRLAGQISGIVSRLERVGLTPGPVTDALFRSLVAAAGEADAAHVAALDPRLRARVRSLCARGEQRLESTWARRIAARPHTLDAFPYLDNYAALAAAEHAALRSALGRRARRLVFAGCGPLPLTAIMLRRLDPGVVITCIDRDRRALAAGRRVARALGDAGNGMAFVHADAARHDYAEADVVLLAALVGATTARKRAVLAGIAASLPADAIVAARSVPGDGRQLLYRRVQPSAVPATLRVLDECQPPPGVINSVLILRRVLTDSPWLPVRGVVIDGSPGCWCARQDSNLRPTA